MSYSVVHVYQIYLHKEMIKK